jgi:hypothetical protein
MVDRGEEASTINQSRMNYEKPKNPEFEKWE